MTPSVADIEAMDRAALMDAWAGHCQRKIIYSPKGKFCIYPTLISHVFFGSELANPYRFINSESSSDSA